MANWANVPAELFVEMVSYLSDDDQISCSGVCSSWYNWINDLILCRQNAIVVRPSYDVSLVEFNHDKIYLANFANNDLEQLSRNPSFLHNRGTELSVIYDNNYKINSYWIELILKLITPTIDYLKFKNIDIISENVDQFLLSAPLTLNSLYLDFKDFDQYNYFLNGQELFSNIYLKFSNKIKLICPGKNVDRTHLIKTEYLDCICSGLNQNQYLKLFSITLKSIELHDAINLDYRSILELSKLKHLNDLKITNSNSISDAEWSEVLNNGFEKLKNLTLKNCCISDKCIEVISKMNITHLNLDLYNLNDSNVLNDLTNLNLFSLTLSVNFNLLNCILNILNDLKMCKFKLKINSTYGSDCSEMMGKISECCDKNGIQFNVRYNKPMFRVKRN